MHWIYPVEYAHFAQSITTSFQCNQYDCCCSCWCVVNMRDVMAWTRHSYCSALTCLLGCQPELSIERRVQLLAMWDAATHIWRHRNGHNFHSYSTSQKNLMSVKKHNQIADYSLAILLAYRMFNDIHYGVKSLNGCLILIKIQQVLHVKPNNTNYLSLLHPVCLSLSPSPSLSLST